MDGDFKENSNNKYFDNVLLHNETVVNTKGFCRLILSRLCAGLRINMNVKSRFLLTSLNAPHGPLIALINTKEFLDEDTTINSSPLRDDRKYRRYVGS